MSDLDLTTFEARLEDRIQSYAQVRVHPVDAAAVARSAHAQPRPLLRWPSFSRPTFAPTYVVLVALGLLLALLFALFAVGGLRRPKPPAPLGRNGLIAYQVEATTNDPTVRIHLMNADGTDDRTVAEGGGATFSGDGSALLYTAVTSSGILQGQPRLMLAAGDGSAPAQIADSWTESSISPDGAQILVAFDGTAETAGSAGRPVLLSPTGAVEQRLDLMPADSAVSFTGFVWSPDGEWIAYAEMRNSGTSRFRLAYRTGISVLNVSSGEVRHLSSIVGTSDVGITWSPDSAHIAFTGLPGAFPMPSLAVDGMPIDAEVAQDIFVVDLNGAVRNVTSSAAFDSGPSWSPDGSRIAYRTVIDAEYQLAVATLGQSGFAASTVIGPVLSDFAWSPDATQLALLVNEAVPGTQQNPPGTASFQGTVETVDAALSQPAVVLATYDSEVSKPSWQWLAP